MPSREFDLYTPGDFQPYYGYKDMEQTPIIICRQTSSVLDFFFGKRPGESYSYTRGYLMRDTLRYVNEAIKGFFTIEDKRVQLIKPEITTLFEAVESRGFSTSVESSEAFSLARVTFGLLPTRFRGTDVVKMPFYGTSSMRPPRTTFETYQRLLEIEAEVLRIICGETPQEAKVHDDSALFRTYAFFKVAGEIPIREHPADEVEVPSDTYRRLLDGINLDLD